MKDASKEIVTEIVEKLSARGYRITAPRKKIIATLVEASHPLTALALAKRVKADTASVYRTLALLAKEDLVEIIETPRSAPRYAYAREHHHHIVCGSCGRVAHIPCVEEFKIPKRVPGFTAITHHDVTFYAHCDTCA